LVVFFLLAGTAFMFGAVVAFFSRGAGDGSSMFSWKDGIGLVEIEGGMYESQEIIDQIEDHRKDNSIKAIILRIDSPGGSVAVSQEIYHAAIKAKEEKPVIASMETVAASGGYYAALGATKILANPGTITGSIGVRMEHVVLKDLLRWAKIEYETLKSGKFKDIGSFDRSLTEEERKLLQDLLTDIHTQFKEAVAEARNLELEDVEKLADGRVFTGKEAFENGLVDQLGGWIDAVELAKGLGNIEGEPRIVQKKKFRYEKFFGGVIKSMFGESVEIPVFKTSL
jgi:protease-4